MTKSQSNSVTRPSSTVPHTGITMKQEDLDVVMAVAERLANNGQIDKSVRDPESATPGKLLAVSLGNLVLNWSFCRG